MVDLIKKIAAAPELGGRCLFMWRAIIPYGCFFCRSKQGWAALCALPLFSERHVVVLDGGQDN